MSLTDAVLLALYSGWSEETWRAGFMHPYSDIVAEFRKWVATLPGPTEDYEREMLVEYHRQDRTRLPPRQRGRTVNHPNLSPELNAALESLDGMVGLFLANLPAGYEVEARTKNTLYRLNAEGLILGGMYNGHSVWGSTWGGSAIRMGWVGQGMHMELHMGEHVVTTTAVREVNIVKDEATATAARAVSRPALRCRPTTSWTPTGYPLTPLTKSATRSTWSTRTASSWPSNWRCHEKAQGLAAKPDRSGSFYSRAVSR